MKANDLVPVDVVDAGVPMGVNLIEVSRLLSWKRRKIIVKWKRGKVPVAIINGYRFSLSDRVN